MRRNCVLSKGGVVFTCGEVLIAVRREQGTSGGLIAVAACTKRIVEDFRSCVGEVGCQIHPPRAHHKKWIFKIAYCWTPKKLHFYSRRQWKGKSIVGKLCSV